MDTEELKIALKNFLNEDGLLTAMPSKHKLQVFAICLLAEKFEKGKVYSEKEVGEILNANTTFKDPALLRRELIDYGFMTRDDYCRFYQMAEQSPDISKLY